MKLRQRCVICNCRLSTRVIDRKCPECRRRSQEVVRDALELWGAMTAGELHPLDERNCDRLTWLVIFRPQG